MGPTKIPIYLETGTRRTFAGAVDWPGWCRAGRDDGGAVDALISAAPRYARVLRGTRLGFARPGDGSAFQVVERLRGDATTDFGAPSIAPGADERTFADDDLRRLGSILRACWRSFDASAEAARGVTLTKGPRGGGRDLDEIVGHVVEAEGGYLRMLGRKVDAGRKRDLTERTRAAVLDALEAIARDGPPPPGPRGGKRWLPRYFVRRAAWHVLDHAWEIEDRST